jgi:DNA gyrase subunit B
MTDADVDGSHIRTLLLTFFYRQYAEIVENGYLYIAQPPLFKVKKGKRELYLKNEQMLDDFLIQSAVEEVRLRGAGGKGRELLGDELAEFIRRAIRYEKVLGILDKRVDSRIIDAIVQAADLSRDDLSDGLKLDKLLAEKVTPYIVERFSDLSQIKLELKPDPEHGGFQIHAPARLGGARKHTIIDFEFLDLPEYDELRKLAAELGKSAVAPYVIERNGDRTVTKLLDVLARDIKEIGRKGLSIQRYKGLGEMNAEQLWETTMDPAKRTLLQVRISDTVAADDIFTVLMGDLVEPRRDFIEKNALNVRNLDV